MRPLSLKTRISLALLVAFVLVAGIASVFAKASLRESEIRHVRDDSQARVDAIARTVDGRLLGLGRAAQTAAEEAANVEAMRVLEELRRAGFSTAIVIGVGETNISPSGEAVWNETLLTQMKGAAPPPNYPATLFSRVDGWVFVSSRSLDFKTAVVGALSETYLTSHFFVDTLIHPEYAHAVVWGDGAVIAANTLYPDDRSSLSIEQADNETLVNNFRDRHVHYSQSSDLTIIHGKIEGLVASETISARVDSMSTRFIFAMAVAFGIGGSVTIVLVAYSFRPLDRITEAARRLGRGEEDLDLKISGNDEIATLADALSHSAVAIAAARRAETARAEEARLAAEDFELAVGDLSRSVGEADTPQEVASRLAEALVRITSARAVVVHHATETLASAGRTDEETDSSAAVEALYRSDEAAFTIARHRAGGEDLEVALLPPDGHAFSPSDRRKIDILSAQAALAVHRARTAVDLRRAKTQKETFLDILSHDLKNPLAVARGRCELLAARDATLGEKLAPVEASLDRATRIIEEAVLLSKLERAGAVECAPLDLSALVEESAAAIQPLAQPRGIRIQVISDGPAMWPASRLLQRAIENLVSNAVKWSPDGKSVELRVDASADRARVHVIDHGPGIPMEDRGRLFARFERADRTNVKGTGLGLAIARRVTEMHHGTIHIEDTPGGGCTFILELPGAGSAPLVPTKEGGA